MKKETIHQHAKRIHELSSTISEIARFEGKEFEDYDAEYLTSSASYLIDLISDWGPGEYDQKEKSRQLTLLRNFVKKWKDQDVTLNELGTKRTERCYDGALHECTCTDYVLAVNGNTYHHRGLLGSLGFRYWNEKAHEWVVNVESQKQLDEVLKAIEGKGIKVLELRPVYRITDTDTNPVRR